MSIQMKRSTALSLTFLLAFLTIAGDGFAQRDPFGGQQKPRAEFPTVDEMADAIDADAEQRAVLAEARLALLQSAKGRRGDDHARPGGHLTAFLVQVAPELDVQETIALVDLLAEAKPGARARDGRRGQGIDGPRRRGGQGQSQGQSQQFQGRGHGSRQGEGRRGGHGNHGNHGRGDQLIHELDLTAEQKDQVEALYATTLGSLRALQRQAAGEPTDAQRDEAARIRTEHQARLDQILTAAQQSELDTLRAKRMAERMTESAERRQAGREKKVEDLTVILDLSASQRSAIESALEEAEMEWTRARNERMGAGGPMPHLFDQGHGRGDSPRQTARDAITEVLNPAQRELFAKLQTMSLQARGPARQGLGRGPRGKR